MQFRIGVNLGDVVEEQDRIYDDGVNIAARLESLAEGGGICISRNAYDQVKSKLDLEFEYLGEKELKNIAEPVRAYRVLMENNTTGSKLNGELELPAKPSIAVLPFNNMSGDPEQNYFAEGIRQNVKQNCTISKICR
jgi:adenylate cyclase